MLKCLESIDVQQLHYISDESGYAECKYQYFIAWNESLVKF